MRIKAYVKFEDEIDVDISTDEISASFCEEFEPATFSRMISNIASFLNAVPPEYIKEKLTASQRSTIKSYLLTQCDRY